MELKKEKTPLIVLIAALAEADQVKPYQLEGTWTREIDENWTIKLNAKRTEQEGIAPYYAAIDYNGLPAGVIGVNGGAIAAGELANEEALARALKKAIKEARENEEE